MTATTVKGREYLRVSQDRSGRARSTDEQHADNLRAGEAHGFTLNGEAYSDVSLSASRYATRVRGDFARLLADLPTGRFGADVLVLWESSRGSRRVGEWATLVDLLQDAGVKVHVTTAERTYDPANPHDRKELMSDAVDAEYDSGKKSVAVRRAAAADAAAGKPHGRIPYGYRRRYSVNRSGKRFIEAQEPEPSEAPVVRELFARLHAGDSLRRIELDFAARGILTRSGKAWTSQMLRDVALRPLYAGLRLHIPGKPGEAENKRKRHGERGSLAGAVKATWPALVDAETFHAVRARLQAPERRTSRPGRGVHLLSMIAACDVCGGPLAASYRRGRREYECHKSNHVRIEADALDALAERAMLAYLARPDVIAELRAGSEDDSELQTVRADLAHARGELAEWRKLAKAGKVTPTSFAEIEPGIVARVAEFESRERELTTPAALSGILLTPGEDAAGRWQAAQMPARREVARLLCSPAYLGTLRLGRSPVPGHHVDPAQRVSWGRP